MHQCFRKGCTAQVSNRMLACYPDWMALTPVTQERIRKTVGLGLLNMVRRRALQTAQDEWDFITQQAEKANTEAQ